MEKKWIVKNGHDWIEVEALKNALQVDKIVAQLLLQRGISNFEEAEQFFRPKLNHLHNPFLMKGMELAVKRLNKAIDNKENILLFGDYDVDGTTAVALLFSYLRMHTAAIDFYIPDRYSEGYGVSFQGIDFAEKHKQTLIIALDCGIKAIDKVAYAKRKGIDFIICDHHEPGDLLPDAIVLDPKQKDCKYPYKELSGCGVGFKLLQALVEQNSYKLEPLYSFLDLVAISIGADIVQITGENRIMCYHGLKQLNEKPRIAFQELILAAKRKFPLTLTDVVFTIAPRINAAGRISSGRTAVELMISKDESVIKKLVSAIEQDNRERKELDKEITAEALTLIEEDKLFQQKSTTVVFQPHWHKGVVGIVASRLIEKHYRPTIVLTETNGIVGGSARSVEHFDLYKALEECSDLLIQFGGHAHAAGMTLKKENVAAFAKKFDEIVKKRITIDSCMPSQVVDICIDLNEIQLHEDPNQIPRLKRIIEAFEPHGPGNMKPVFMTSNLFASDSRVLKDEHLKLRILQPNSKYVFDAIGFSLADREVNTAKGIPFEMVYTLETNEFNGKKSIQLNIKDIRAMTN